jgi:hypothetical protein
MRAHNRSGADAPGLAVPELARVDQSGLAAQGAPGAAVAELIDPHEDEAPGLAGTEGFRDQRKTDKSYCANGKPKGKRIAAQRALLALVGVALIKDSENPHGRFFTVRRGMSSDLPTLADVEALADRLGVWR